jgi:hypothetical protein
MRIAATAGNFRTYVPLWSECAMIITFVMCASLVLFVAGDDATQHGDLVTERRCRCSAVVAHPWSRRMITYVFAGLWCRLVASLMTT